MFPMSLDLTAALLPFVGLLLASFVVGAGAITAAALHHRRAH